MSEESNLDIHPLAKYISAYFANQIYNGLYQFTTSKYQKNPSASKADIFISTFNEYNSAFIDDDRLTQHIRNLTKYIRDDIGKASLQPIYNETALVVAFTNLFIPEKFAGMIKLSQRWKLLSGILYRVQTSLLAITCNATFLPQILEKRSLECGEKLRDKFKELLKREQYNVLAYFYGEASVSVTREYIEGLISELVSFKSKDNEVDRKVRILEDNLAKKDRVIEEKNKIIERLLKKKGKVPSTKKSAHKATLDQMELEAQKLAKEIKTEPDEEPAADDLFDDLTETKTEKQEQKAGMRVEQKEEAKQKENTPSPPVEKKTAIISGNTETPTVDKVLPPAPVEIGKKKKAPKEPKTQEPVKLPQADMDDLFEGLKDE